MRAAGQGRAGSGATSQPALGIVLNTQPYYPATDSPEDHAHAELENAKFTGRFMDPLFKGCYPEVLLRHLGRKAPHVLAGDFEVIAQPLDFLGINYYTRGWSSVSAPVTPLPRALGVTDMGREIYPQGLTEQLLALHRDYALPPVYITENGMACADVLDADGAVHDAARIDYLQRHFDALASAMEQGVEVRGYFQWSLLDNFERCATCCRWAIAVSALLPARRIRARAASASAATLMHWWKRACRATAN